MIILLNPLCPTDVVYGPSELKVVSNGVTKPHSLNFSKSALKGKLGLLDRHVLNGNSFSSAFDIGGQVRSEMTFCC